jgi:hypothetical protein
MSRPIRWQSTVRRAYHARNGDREDIVNFPFRDPKITKLDRPQIAELLLTIEDIWAEHSGGRLSSAEFYSAYCEGQHDSPFFMAWATYYEAYRRLPGDEDVAAASRELAPLVAA